MKGLLLRLTWTRRTALCQRQLVLFFGGVIVLLHLNPWGACLAIPILKLSQVLAIGVCHRSQEIIAGNRLTIMALKVEIHSFAEAVFTQKSLIHPNNF